MIDTRILIGLIAILVTISSIVYIGINESARQEEFKQAFHGRSVENGAALFTEFCAPCHGLKGEGSPRAPTLNSQHFFENRLDELGFTGTMEAYLELTIAGGRPAMSTSGPWPENMPFWSVDYGGPLRNDQILNIVDYIMNWEAEAPDLAVQAAEPVEGDTPEERGRNLFQGSAGCVACHAINGEGGNIAPDLTNVFDKGEEYVRESILSPNAVVVEGFQSNIMPLTYSDSLSEQDLDDIVAYLESVSGN